MNRNNATSDRILNSMLHGKCFVCGKNIFPLLDNLEKGTIVSIPELSGAPVCSHHHGVDKIQKQFSKPVKVIENIIPIDAAIQELLNDKNNDA